MDVELAYVAKIEDITELVCYKDVDCTPEQDLMVGFNKGGTPNSVL